MLKTYLLIHLLSTSTITPTEDGLYTLTTPEGKVYEYACKGEVISYLETGTFKYDERLCTNAELTW